jgi:hypothetical protein
MTDPHVSSNHGVRHFTVADIMKYVPKSVLQMIEKKDGEEGNSSTRSTNVESRIQQIVCDIWSMNYDPLFFASKY